MTNVIYWGAFRPVTTEDLEDLPATMVDVETHEIIPNPFRNPKMPNWRNEAGHFLFPEVRDAIGDNNLAIVVGDDNIVYAYGSGVFAPAPDRGGRMYELLNVRAAQADEYRMKLFDPATGTASEPPAPVPLQISAAQAKIWLRRQNLRAQADAAVAAADGEIQDWYAFANTWEYNNSYVTQFCTALGIDKEQAFREAALIV